MSTISDIIDIGLAPLFLSCSDMILLFYLCGGTWETIRRKKYWGLWFVLTLISLAITQFVFNGRTGENAQIIVFYFFRFLILVVFAILCTDMPRNACYYLTILVLLSMDICLITLVRGMQGFFNTDYLVSGPYIYRIISHIFLLLLKIAVIVSIKSQTKNQVYGIDSLFQAGVIILPAVPFFYLRDYSRIFAIRPANIPWSIHLITNLCGICAITNMILSESLSYQTRQNEKLHMESIIKKQHNQYMITLNTIDVVNRKYHDLRHILRGIDSLQTVDEIKTYVHNIEGEIKDYELICNSGNKTLDIILSEKMRFCKEKNIQMHVHSDGQDWDLVRDIDAATIFGNALDNAIESTEPIEDRTLRLIDVRIGKVNHMLIARFENPYTHPLEKKQMKWISTKSDRQNHGYGLQSIELAVKKYKGELDIKTDDGKFTLTVIIPVP
jgi:hypothetical protein